MMKTLALYPGSFDPVTKGHEDLIRRCASLFENLVVAVAHNPNKQVSLFEVEERLAFLIQSVQAMGLSYTIFRSYRQIRQANRCFGHYSRFTGHF